ncbi:hypothetical protein BS17DRAFT_211429 [Gyrodon lividus]|nr:hypothetical protein BS17DRAFT_211429 [Gyrodon lividus]
MSEQNFVAAFWSEVLKDRHRMTSHPIPCIDGGHAKYSSAPEGGTIRAKMLQCTLQDLPRDSVSPCGFYTSIPTPRLTPTLHIWIPYVEMHSPTHTDAPPDELGNTGDVFIIEAARKPSFWVRGPGRWSSVDNNILSEHPFVKGHKATYRDGAIVWERLMPLKPARRPLSRQQPTVTSFGHPWRMPQASLLFAHRRHGVPTANTSAILPAFLPPTPIAGSRSRDPVALAPSAVSPSPSSFSLRSAGKRTSRSAPEASPAGRDPKRMRPFTEETELVGQAVSKKRSISGSVSSTPSLSNSVPIGGEPETDPCILASNTLHEGQHTTPDAPLRASIPAASSDVESLQLLIQQKGESITRQNEELAILRKRNAELCSEKVTVTQEREKLEDELTSLKVNGEWLEKVVVQLQADLAEVHAKLDHVSGEMRKGSETSNTLSSKLRVSEQKRWETNNAHAFSLDVIIGLRHALSWQQSKNRKLKKDSYESSHRHVQQYTVFEGLIQSAKDSLLRSHASEAILSGDKERLQGKLEESLAIVEGFQRDLNEERANCRRLQDEVRRLEVEVNALLAQAKSAEATSTLEASAQLGSCHIQSFPPQLRAKITLFLGSIYDTFSKMQDELTVEKERAVSANEMYANERDAHAESRRTSEQQLDQVTQERDAVLRTSQSSQRELSEIREILGRLSRPPLT